MIPLLYLLFFLSGAAGLMYESVWARYLGLFVGHEAYAQVLVLVIFLGGMAAGAAWVARRADQYRFPLRSYALVEAIVGLIALVFHPMFVAGTGLVYDRVFPALGPGIAATIVQWGLAALLILPQSLLLGATFPLMVSGVLRLNPTQPGRTVGWLYFTNSLGAAVGVLVAGFGLIAWWGLPGVTRTAGLLNLFVGLAVLLLQSGPTDTLGHPRVPLEQRTSSAKSPMVAVLLGASLLTAVASFFYEIGWIRMLSLVLGSATHSFELMLSAFILGIALGALWIRRRIDSLGNPVLVLAIVQVVMGMLAVATLPVYQASFGWMSTLLGTLAPGDSGYAAFAVGRYLLCLLVMLPATFCAGMTLPLITKLLLDRSGSESAVGLVYAFNTGGAILGIVLAALLLLPILGVRGVIVAGGVLDIGVGAGLLVFLHGLRRRALLVPATGTAFVLAFLFLPWDSPHAATRSTTMDLEKWRKRISRPLKPKVEVRNTEFEGDGTVGNRTQQAGVVGLTQYPSGSSPMADSRPPSFLPFEAPNRKAYVVPSESEGIGERHPHLAPDRAVRGTIEVAVRIRGRLVDGRRNRPTRDGEQGNHRFEGARSAQQMASHGLGGAEHQALRVLPEHGFDRERLRNIAERRGGAVRVDVPDVARVDLPVFQAGHHRSPRPVAIRARSRDVVRVGTHAVPDHLAQNRGTPAGRMLQTLEDERRTSVGQHEPIPLLVERTASQFRGVVPGGERFHVLESGDRQPGDRRLGAAGDDTVRRPGSNQLEGFPDGMGRGRTGRHRSEIRSFEPIADGHVPRSDIGNEHRDEEGGDPVRTLGEIDERLLFQRHHSSDSAADDDSAALGCGELPFEPGLGHRLMGGGDGVLAEQVHPLRLFFFQIGQRIEALHFTGEANLEFAGVEFGDRSGAGFAGEEILPRLRHTQANRRHHAGAGHHDPPGHSYLPSLS